MLQLETRENRRQPLHSNQSLPLYLPSPSSVCLSGAGSEQAPGRRWLYLGPAGESSVWQGRLSGLSSGADVLMGWSIWARPLKKKCWYLPFLPRLFKQTLSSDKIAIPSWGSLRPITVEHSCKGQLGFPWVWSVSREKGGYQQICLGTAAPNATSAAPISPALLVACVLLARCSLPASSCHQAAPWVSATISDVPSCLHNKKVMGCNNARHEHTLV